MKYKSIIKLCVIPLLASSCLTFTSCFYRSFVIEDYSIFDSPDIAKFKQDSEYLKFISERSLSLRFKIKNDLGESFVNGTSWIISKDDNEKNVYYLATNLHVAAIPNNSGKLYKSAYFDYNNKKLVVSEEIDPIVLGMDVGIIWDEDSTPGTKLSTQNQNTKLKYIENINNNYYSGNFNVSPSLNINDDFSIVYSANQTFKNFNILDPSKLRYDSQYILNPTADFAVLKVNFSKFYDQPYNFKYSSQLINMLSYYDSNQTKFATSVNESENLYVGGFPAETQLKNGSYVPRWVGVEINNGWNIKEGHKNNYGNQSLPILGYKNYRVNNLSEISFTGVGKPNIYNNDGGSINGNVYFSQKNVAVNGLVDGLNLLGGSSGSMVINSNKEVVGIYWGGFEKINSFSGAFDLINVNQSIINLINFKNGGININSWRDVYNLYDEFKKAI